MKSIPLPSSININNLQTSYIKNKNQREKGFVYTSNGSQAVSWGSCEPIKPQTKCQKLLKQIIFNFFYKLDDLMLVASPNLCHGAKMKFAFMFHCKISGSKTNNNISLFSSCQIPDFNMKLSYKS